MKNELKSLKAGKRILLFSSALVAGITNALLGTGGGIILIYALGFIFKDKPSRDVFALSLSSVFVMSLLSAVIYGAGGRFVFSDFSPLILPALIGGAIGSLILKKINGKILKRIFSALLIISGLLILLR